MLRKLLVTTAIASVVATGAYAQSTTTTTTNPAPAASETAPAAIAEGHLASNLIGENVYNGTSADAETIGDVTDLLIADDGTVQSVVIGVGGFLGIGEKDVALPFADLQWGDRDGERVATVATSADALKALPAFDRDAYDDDDMDTADNTTAPSGSAATTTAPAASNTVAPATSTSAVDRSTLKEVPAADLTAENLEGTTVYGANDANVGDIGDVVLTADGKVDAIIIDVGGFLGIGEKPVAVGMDNLAFMQDGDGDRYLYTDFTKEQLEAQPEYEEGNWAAQRDQMRMTVPR